jgi:hypothetical protein
MSADTVSQAPAAGSAFSLGWLMAQLFGPLQHRPKTGTTAHLPTVSELGRASRMNLAFAELDGLLNLYPNLSSATVKAAWQADGHEGFNDAVQALHLKLLQRLAGDRSQLSAYQLGRALNDTCWLPNKDEGAEFFLRQFNRHRLATLQSWLAQASAALPPLSAATVSRSLQNWQDWADANTPALQKNWDTTAHRPVVAALRTQASAWHALLAGQTDTSGQTSPDAWIHAGQSIVRTIRVLMSAILRRFWLVVIIIAAATGGLLYLAIANSSETAKVWASLVTVAGALGLSGAGLRTAGRRVASGIEQDIQQAAILDAHGWAATWLPALPQGPVLRYRLASRGVAPPQTRKRLAAATPSEPEPEHQAPAEQDQHNDGQAAPKPAEPITAT